MLLKLHPILGSPLEKLQGKITLLKDKKKKKKITALSVYRQDHLNKLLINLATKVLTQGHDTPSWI